MLKIDSHTHILPKKMPNWTEKFGYGDFIYLQHHKKGFAKMMRGNQFFREIKENCWDPDVRIAEYAQHGTEVQVACTIPVMFSYWAKAIDGLSISKFLNDHLGELCEEYPLQYVGLGTLPMQDTELAVKELERCQRIGLKGVQIGSNINDENLNEDRFYPVFEAAQQLDMAVLVHPWEMMGEKKMQRYWLPWLVGMPAETSRALCSMIFGGVLERLPELRVMFAHAGGSFLPTLGRIQHGYDCRPDLVAIDNRTPPKNYLGRFWIDSITHDPLMLEYILKMVPANRVALGSDYPFPLGDLEIGKFIEDMNLPLATQKAIFHGAALEWLGMTIQDFVKTPQQERVG
jgi:aminocarboxymuconate-semialdehyde decarboxylase